MRIRWSPAAANDLERIFDYLEEHQPSLAQPTVRKLYEAARSLRQFAYRGRTGQAANTRELVLVPLPYVIVYRVREQVVEISRILHTSQERPRESSDT